MVIEITIEQKGITYNQATYAEDFYAFTYIKVGEINYLVQEITLNKANSKVAYSNGIFAATTERECVDEKIRLNLL